MWRLGLGLRHLRPRLRKHPGGRGRPTRRGRLASSAHPRNPSSVTAQVAPTLRGRPEVAAAVLSLSLLLPACAADRDGGDPWPDALTVSDSAGVEIVRVPWAELERLPTLVASPDPVTSAGRLEGPAEELLGSVIDAARLEDGRVVVADWQQGRLLVFGEDGRFEHAIGARGDGPGEFRSVGRIAVKGDTVWVADGSAARIQTFLADGTVVGQQRARGGAGLQMGLYFFRPTAQVAPFLYFVAPDGYPWHGEEGGLRAVAEGDGPHRVIQIFARADSLGTARRDTVPRASTYYVGGTLAAHPLAADVHGAFVEDRPVIGWAESGEIHFHGPGFELRQIVQIERGPMPLVASPELAAWAVALRPYHERRWGRRAAEVLPPPERLPAFFSLEPGTRGMTWIAMTPEAREGAGVPWTRWLRLDDSGRPTHWVVAPTLHYLEMGERHLVALERDELEVQRVGVYPLER